MKAKRFLIILLILVEAILPIATHAERSKLYIPPAKKKDKRSHARVPAGSSGCEINAQNTVHLIVPENHTGTTVSAQPTFLWYTSQKLTLPLRFTLLEPGNKPIMTKDIKNPQSGFMAIKLSKENSLLKVGKTYRWTVTVVCNPKKPAKNLFAHAWIERAASSSNTKSNNLDCDAYGKKGIWYDAVACFYKKRSESLQSKTRFQTLLREINLDLPPT